MTNVIGDIAGQYKTLMALIEKMPDGEVISVGDMVDRGPRSKEVLEYFMNNGRALLGNHEHMMIDYYKSSHHQYDSSCWLRNGGFTTAEQFTEGIPRKVMDFLQGLPLYLEVDGCLITHGFVTPDLGLENVCREETLASDSGMSIVWGREQPKRMEEYDLQVAGHNSHFGLKRFSDNEGEFAICLDTSREGILTGIHLPTKEIFQQEFID